MDFWDILVFVLLVFAVIVIGAVYLYKVVKTPTTIPGPEPDNYMQGNIPDIIACGSLHEFLCKAHKQYGPIVSLWLGPRMCISLGSSKLFASQAHVFDRGYDLFTSLLSLIPGSIQVANGSEGRRRHAMYSQCFTPTAIRQYFGAYNTEAEKVIDTWLRTPQDELIPLMKHMFDYTIRTILFAVYDFSCDEPHLVSSVHESYKVCFAEFDRQFKGDISQPGTDRNKHFLQHINNFRQLMNNIVTRRRTKITAENSYDTGKKMKDMIDAALALNLDEETLLSDLVTVFIGGFHTSASLLTWAIYCLAVNTDIQAAAREEVKRVCSETGDITADDVNGMIYLAQILNETLRWAVVGPYAARVQDTDSVIAGHHVPAGTNVIQALGVALHDPDVFPQPDKFDPDRFSADRMEQLPEYAFEPFGFAGKRKCLGYRFAFAEVSVLLAKLLRSGMQFSLAPGQTVIAKYDITGKPAEEVWIKVEQAN